MYYLVGYFAKGMSINDVYVFGLFDLPAYLVLLYKVPFWGLSWTPLSTLISDVINGHSLTLRSDHEKTESFRALALYKNVIQERREGLASQGGVHKLR